LKEHNIQFSIRAQIIKKNNEHYTGNVSFYPSPLSKLKNSTLTIETIETMIHNSTRNSVGYICDNKHYYNAHSSFNSLELLNNIKAAIQYHTNAVYRFLQWKQLQKIYSGFDVNHSNNNNNNKLTVEEERQKKELLLLKNLFMLPVPLCNLIQKMVMPKVCPFVCALNLLLLINIFVHFFDFSSQLSHI
jgi:hypothetical protein